MKYTHTVMAVDDEPTNIFLLSKILESKNYKVLTAKSGEESLQIMKTVLPDLVLLDLMMPGINGFEVLIRMKSNSTTQAIPVVIITAMCDSKTKEKAFNLGASGFLTKPISLKVIIDTIRNLLIDKNSINYASIK